MKPGSVVVAITLAMALGGPAAAQQGRAGIYVDTGEEVSSRCVAISDEGTTGEELLRSSGLPVVADARALGTAVCRIGATGCDADDCFCDYPTFWGYWTRDGTGDWTFSEVGASDRIVVDGSLDGWSYGRDGKPSPPDDVTFAGVCDRTAAMPAAMDERSPRPDYLPFAALAAILAAAAFALGRRRRSR